MKKKKQRRPVPGKNEKHDNFGLPENIRVVHSGEPNPHDG